MLSSFARIMEGHGLRVLGAHEVAPEILVREGVLGRCAPDERDRSDHPRMEGLFRIDQQRSAVSTSARPASRRGQQPPCFRDRSDRGHRPDARARRRAASLGHRHPRSGRAPGVLGQGAQAQSVPSFRSPHHRTANHRRGRRVLVFAGSRRADVAGEAIIAEPAQVTLAADRAGIFVVGMPAYGSVR